MGFRNVRPKLWLVIEKEKPGHSSQKFKWFVTFRQWFVLAQDQLQLEFARVEALIQPGHQNQTCESTRPTGMNNVKMSDACHIPFPFFLNPPRRNPRSALRW
jgi:hypothetical protein